MLDHLLRHSRIAILPGKPPFGFKDVALHDEAFRFWLAYWQSTYREVGLPVETINADDFLRHDLVHVLLHQDKVIGMINCTLLDFAHAAARSHSYVNTYFGEPFLASVAGLGLKRMATLENIFLDPTWRSSRVGFSLGAVLMTIALKQTREAGCDGIFGCPRKDAPTSRICYDLGARPVTQNLTFHGKPTDLVAWKMTDVKPDPSANVNRMAEALWRERQDLTAWTMTPNPTQKVA